MPGGEKTIARVVNVCDFWACIRAVSLHRPLHCSIVYAARFISVMAGDSVVVVDVLLNTYMSSSSPFHLFRDDARPHIESFCVLLKATPPSSPLQ